MKMKPKTASEAAKQAGHKSLLEVSEITGKPTQTLNAWFNNEPELFQCVIFGAIIMKLKNQAA